MQGLPRARQAFATEVCLQPEFRFLNEYVCFSSQPLCSEAELVVGVMVRTHLHTVLISRCCVLGT